MENTSQLQSAQSNKTQTSQIESNGNFQNEIDTAWQFYHEQVKRNFGLMKIINELQQVIEQAAGMSIPNMQSTMAPPNLQSLTQAASTPEQQFREIQSLPLHRYKKIEQIFSLFNHGIKRKDALQHIIEMLNAIHQIGEVSPERLYMQLAIPDSSGYRYLRALQNTRLIKITHGKIALRNSGLALMNNPLENQEQILELTDLLKSENLIIDNGQLISVHSWINRLNEEM